MWDVILLPTIVNRDHLCWSWSASGANDLFWCRDDDKQLNDWHKKCMNGDEKLPDWSLRTEPMIPALQLPLSIAAVQPLSMGCVSDEGSINERGTGPGMSLVLSVFHWREADAKEHHSYTGVHISGRRARGICTWISVPVIFCRRDSSRLCSVWGMTSTCGMAAQLLATRKVSLLWFSCCTI